MSLQLVIYLASIVNGVTILLGLFGGFTIGFGFVYIFILMESEKHKTAKIYLRHFMFISVPCLILAVIIPDKDAIYLMAGVSAVDQVSNTVEAHKARQVLNLGLDTIINKLQKENK